MRIWIQGLSEQDTSYVRGVGTYITSTVCALKRYGQKHDLILDSRHPEVVIHPGFFPYTPLSPIKGVKNILVIHDLIALKYPKHFPSGIRGKLRWFLNKKKLKQFDGFITDTQVVRGEIITMFHIPATKVAVVPLVTKEIFYTTAAQKKKLDYILYVGDITWNKNLPVLARAVKQAGVKLVLVGKALAQCVHLNHPWHRSFAEFLSEVKNDPHFTFAGFVSDADLVQLYHNARATLFPSIDEGFGYPWLESALQKTPVILSDIPVFHEVSSNAAYFVDPRSPESIAEGIRYVFAKSSTDLCQRAYQAAQRYTYQRFVAALYQGLYTVLHG